MKLKRFPTHTFHTTDINDIASGDLARFDLIISIGTLQIHLLTISYFDGFGAKLYPQQMVL